MRRFTCSTLFVIGLASAFWGCSNDTPVNSIVKPSDKTETFTGTLTPNGAQTFPFTATGAGAITATLSVLSPDTTTPVGFALGTWDGAACQIVIANDKAIQGTSVIAAATAVGNLCARVYDVGNLTVNEAVTVTVIHP